jgi:2-polyprenyl-3-methyl-5-hydroxy-6-metoxy-1,4-benzoquinol methylase
MTTENCPICGGERFPLFEALDENRRVSDERFQYWRCAGCGSAFLSPVPDNLGQYYPSDYYAIPSLGRLRRIAARNRVRIDTVLKFVREGRLLEIGPAYGVFAWQARTAGFDVETIEMDGGCCEFLREKVGVRVTQTDDPERGMRDLQQHEVIALWHCLEHAPNPLGLLRAASANLAAGGILAIGMPNPQSVQFRLLRQHWPHLDAPRHLHLIPASKLAEVARHLGLVEVHRSFNNSETRYWNRFGWQHALANRFRHHWSRKAMLLPGFLLSLLAAPFEIAGCRGSAYTIIFRKQAGA